MAVVIVSKQKRRLQSLLSVWLFPQNHLVPDHVVGLSIAKWGEGSHLGRTFTPILKSIFRLCMPVGHVTGKARLEPQI